MKVSEAMSRDVRIASPGEFASGRAAFTDIAST